MNSIMQNLSYLGVTPRGACCFQALCEKRDFLSKTQKTQKNGENGENEKRENGERGTGGTTGDDEGRDPATPPSH